MNVGIRTVAAQFLSWDNLLRFFGIVSSQCGCLYTVYGSSLGFDSLPSCVNDEKEDK